jgi:L-amino acid N-acyltransferase YncA
MFKDTKDGQTNYDPLQELIGKAEDEFDKMTPEDEEIPSAVTDLYGEGSVDEWLKEHTNEHLYENSVYVEPMCDLDKDKVRSFLSTQIEQAYKAGKAEMLANISKDEGWEESYKFYKERYL